MSNFGKLLSLMTGIVRYRRSVVQFLKHRGNDAKAFSGSVMPDELPFLKELVEQSSRYSGPIVEIGTLFGFTTQHIAQYKQPAQELITVDDFSWNPVGFSPEAHRDFCFRSLYYLTQCANTTIYDGAGGNFYSSYTGEVPSMVFIDADHSYAGVRADIDWAVEQGVPIISGHDYSDVFPGVKKAVNETFSGDFRVSGSVWAYVAGP